MIFSTSLDMVLVFHLLHKGGEESNSSKSQPLGDDVVLAGDGMYGVRAGLSTQAWKTAPIFHQVLVDVGQGRGVRDGWWR